MKSSDLTLTDAFFQVNLWKGFRYLDTAGVLMNDLEDRFESLQATVSGLLVRKPRDSGDFLKELRVSSEQVWLHYGTRTPWVTLRKEIPDTVNRIATTLEVRGYKRRGFRANLILPIDDVEQTTARLASAFDGRLASWDELGTVTTPDLVCTVRVDDAHARVSIHAGHRNPAGARTSPVDEADQPVPQEQDHNLPTQALIVDVDFYDDRETRDYDVGPHINRAARFLEIRIPNFLSRLVEG